MFVHQPWLWRLGLLTTVLCVCSYLQIYHTVVVNNLYPVAKPSLLRQYNNDEQLVDVLWSVMTSATPFGKFIGTLASGFLADRFGRKPSMLVSVSTLTIGAVLMLLARPLDRFELVIAGRLVNGFAVGLSLVVATLMITESAPKDYRGFFSSLQQIFFGLGDLIGLVLTVPVLMGTEELWIYAMALACLPAPFMLPILVWCPDSPRHLYLKLGDKIRAVKAIEFYQGAGHLEETVDDLMQEQDNHGKECSYRAMLHDSSIYKPLLLTVIIKVGTQCTGIGVYMAFSTPIFLQAGFSSGQATMATLLLGTVKCFSGFLLPLLMDRWGRRPLLQLGIMGCTACNLCNVCLFWFVPLSYGKAAMVVASISTFLLFYTFLSGAAATIAGELFTQRARAKALVLANSLSWLSATVITAAFLPIVGLLSTQAALAPFTVVSLLMCVYFCICLPETKHKTFNSISRENFGFVFKENVGMKRSETAMELVSKGGD